MTSTTKHTPTLKDYLTQDMTDEPMTYREWLDSLPVIDGHIYNFDIYALPKMPSFRPIYGPNLITYPYTVPYKDS